MARQTESPSGGERKINTQVVDSVKPANSGLSEGGFYRPVQKFNRNGVMDSPTTSSREFRQQPQEIKPNRGFAGKIKY
jgi:hypothetical protein